MEALFEKVAEVSDATHIYVQGSHQNSNEIVTFSQHSKTFLYRFVKYKLDESVKAGIVFRPAVFDIKKALNLG